MKYILMIFLFAFSLFAQNKIGKDNKTEKPMLIGECNVEAFQDSNFAWWYNSEFNNYEPNEEVMSKLDGKLTDTKVEVIFGSWCSDSRREVPRFVKILDLLNYDLSNLELIAVDRDKKAPDVSVEEQNIELVPTFIIYQDGEEIGRIIETPINTLEEDLLDILKN